jgi:hypothetical protein
LGQGAAWPLIATALGKGKKGKKVGMLTSGGARTRTDLVGGHLAANEGLLEDKHGLWYLGVHVPERLDRPRDLGLVHKGPEDVVTHVQPVAHLVEREVLGLQPADDTLRTIMRPGQIFVQRTEQYAQMLRNDKQTERKVTGTRQSTPAERCLAIIYGPICDHSGQRPSS